MAVSSAFCLTSAGTESMLSSKNLSASLIIPGFGKARIVQPHKSPLMNIKLTNMNSAIKGRDLIFSSREFLGGMILFDASNYRKLNIKLHNSGMQSAKVLAQNVDNEKTSSGGKTSYGVLSFLCPLLKLFSGGNAAAPRNRILEVATSGLASMARLPWGSKVREDIVNSRSSQPEKALQLYEFEACPFCRRVREALTELDLSVEVYPCPKDSLWHRPLVRQLGGKEQFPYLADPNTGIALYESGDIVKYLFKQYGGGAKPTPGLLESTILTGWIPTLTRAGRGMSRYEHGASSAPARRLELYSYENNQFARLVREALCELELPYVLRNVGKNSGSRDALLQLAGTTQVPYLVDPNTNCTMGQSDAIVSYLFQTYGMPGAASV